MRNSLVVHWLELHTFTAGGSTLLWLENKDPACRMVWSKKKKKKKVSFYDINICLLTELYPKSCLFNKYFLRLVSAEI